LITPLSQKLQMRSEHLPDTLGLFFNNSEGETVAARSEESGVAVAGGFDAGEKLMRCVSAAVLMTLGAVLIVPHRHAGARGRAAHQSSSRY
jgi:hypothetical protein